MSHPWCLIALAGAIGLCACRQGSESVAGLGNNADLPGSAALSRFGRGFVVWESNRSGAWRIWMRAFDAAGESVVTPDDTEYDHFCPHISPDGSRMVYLRYAKGTTAYDHAASAQLQLFDFQTREVRTVLESARSYREDRAAVWINSSTVCVIDGRGMTVALDVDTGACTAMLAEVGADYGWLINAPKTHATTGIPRFSGYLGEQKALVPGVLHSGCQPYFSRDGVWGYWTGGAGGPINRIHLPSGHFDALLQRQDAQLSKGWDYLYFPMTSPCQSLLAFGASQGGHDHFAADYEVFVMEIDPDTLEPMGPAVRCTFSGSCDRFPDVWRETPALGLHNGEGQVHVAFPAGQPGQWLVDGKPAEAQPSGRFERTFQGHGLHEIRFLPDAEDATSQVARVAVRAAKAPSLVRTVRLAKGEWALHFDEAVTGENAILSVPDGEARWSGVEGGNRILRILVAENAPEFAVAGVADFANPPNVLDKFTISLGAERWPPTDSAPCLMWAAVGDGRERAPSEEGPVSPEFLPSGLAFPDFDGAMRLEGGMFTTQGVAHDAMVAACRKTGEFSVELVVDGGEPTPWEVPMTLVDSLMPTAPPHAVVGVGGAELPFHFGIYRRANDVLFGVFTDEGKRRSNRQDSRVEHVLTPGRARHVVLTYGAGEMTFFSDAEPSYIRSKVRGGLSGWMEGGTLNIGGGWRGRVSALAVYPRRLHATDVALHKEAALPLLKEGTAAGSCRTLRGTFVRSASFPDLEAILPYRDALVLHEYRVDAGSEGFAEGETVIVARFALRDGRALSSRDMREGQVEELRLRLLEDHPQARSLMRSEIDDGDPSQPVWFTLDALHWATE